MTTDSGENSLSYQQRHHSIAHEEILKSYFATRNPAAVFYAMWMLDPDMAGKMSDDFGKQIIFLAVSSITVITRFCIEGGMPEHLALAISDAYLQKLDYNMSFEEVKKWHYQATQMFFNMMPALSDSPTNASEKKTSYSKSVSAAIDYILGNIHSRLSLENVSSAIFVTPAHLSRSFRNETGITFTSFVRKCKINLAKDMLINSDMSCTEVAYSLSYCNQSHFINAFKKETGLSPTTYAQRMRESFENLDNT
ncbi:MAG: AraC family transcriptional regulator [Lachnospiraceae bacterium]|nr:AraC family transcriptional regulator [Lachnospiraceae bacterium]